MRLSLGALPGRLIRRLERRPPQFATSDVQIGRRVTFGSRVVFNCRRVRIGDGVIIHDDVRIDADEFEIGDYGTIYPGSFFPGPGAIRIGHNFWMGNGAIVDCMGGTTIGHNVCVGARAQLWTHMAFGDVMLGCRFHTVHPLVVGDDAWLSSSVIVSAAVVGERSLALPGAVVTREMAPDRSYAGLPAEDVTDRVGPQFAFRPVPERAEWLRRRLHDFAVRHGDLAVLQRLIVAASAADAQDAPQGATVFNVDDRTYTKQGTDLEAVAMRFLLPDAKFVPATPTGHDTTRVR